MVKPLSHINNVVSGCGWPRVPLPQSVVYPSHPDGPLGIYSEKEQIWSGYTVVADITHAGKTDVSKKMFAHLQCQLLENVLAWKGTADFPRWGRHAWKLAPTPALSYGSSQIVMAQNFYPKNHSHYWGQYGVLEESARPGFATFCICGAGQNYLTSMNVPCKKWGHHSPSWLVVMIQRGNECQELGLSL